MIKEKTLFGDQVIPTKQVYYIDEHMDEMPPCDCTLAGWALFLDGQGIFDDPHVYPRANCGDQFPGSIAEYAEICAARNPDGSYSFRDPPDGFEFHAITNGSGFGWSPEMIVGSRAELEEVLSKDCHDDFEYIAIRRRAETVGTVVFTYDNEGQPVCTFEASEQGEVPA